MQRTFVAIHRAGFAECWDADAGPFALCSPYSVSSVLTTGPVRGRAAGTAPQAEQDAARPVHGTRC